ncbi:MAG: asparaginase [Clostridia bacterium]|nr:asparaginase [Clostridia bacterium]
MESSNIKILLVHTGGTIGSVQTEEQRETNTAEAKRTLFHRFETGKSKYAFLGSGIFEDTGFSPETFSENMTVKKLDGIVKHINEHLAKADGYKGIIVLHGTDTLAYTAALFSILFNNIRIPMMLVSGNRPPKDNDGNANANFAAAVEMIVDGIAPNVYVPYGNMDGKMWLHLASSIRQCTNFSEDFYSIDKNRMFLISDQSKRGDLMRRASDFSAARSFTDFSKLVELNGEKTMAIIPYTGLDYARIDASGKKAVLHGTYHSGTLCVERHLEKNEEKYSSKSVLWFADKYKGETLIFMAPAKESSDNYSSTFDAIKNGGLIPLNMTFESAYAKLLVGTSQGFEGEKLVYFMKKEINSEFAG